MDQTVKKSLKECDKIIPLLRIISNTTRFKILCILNQGEMRVGDIQKLLGAKQSYVSQQLKYLKDEGYLSNRRNGTQIYYQLVDRKFPEILKVMKNILSK